MPLFTKATLHLENGKDFVISAPNKTAKRIHVKSVKLNGKLIKDYTLTHQQIMAGGSLEFILK
jgi:putative alpha-1,2-mannosidase